MTAKIQILDMQAANQIAAGEVVERPVSVVKELIENALDAKATQIEVIIEGSGVEKIRIQDNGQGIPAEDLPLAVLRHATSKIRSIDDLSKLQTLGFRGEALPSIASVSKLEIISRPPTEVSGKVLRLAGGEKLELADIGCPAGTTITVEDLFFNTPARRKFLKSKNTEFGQISDIIGRLSLARPDVSFTLKHPKIVVLQTPGKGNLLESIGAVLGRDTARRLLPVTGAQGEWRLEGYISPPDLVRSTRQGETLIVNQRIIRSNSISRAILEGYHTLIPSKLYPIAVLNLQIPPHEYDVNVHPTKMEVRFHKEKELMDFISAEIRKTLLAAHPIAPFAKNTTTSASSNFDKASSTQYALHFAPERPQGMSQGKTLHTPKNLSTKAFTELLRGIPIPQSKDTQFSINTPPSSSAKEPATILENKEFVYENLIAAESTPAMEMPDIKAASANSQVLSPETLPVQEHALKQVQGQAQNQAQEPEEGLLAPVSQEVQLPVTSAETLGTPASEELQSVHTLTEAQFAPSSEEVQMPSQELYVIAEEVIAQNLLLALRPIGQVFNTYILTTDGEQLVIIDQHAAHERINYERLLNEHQKNPGSSQMLLIPLTMEFTPGEEEALLEHFLLLNEMGFVLEQFGTRTYLLRGIPAYSGPYQGEKLLRDFLDKVLLNHIPPTMDQLLEEWIYLLACKSSIKAKETLNILEMEQLIVQLSKTANPYTCPHGRPTMIQLTREELEHRFYRS